MKCRNCGKVFSYMKSDIKAGRIKDPELCPSCSKVGKVDRITETVEPKYFQGAGVEVRKGKHGRKKKKDVPESVDVDEVIENSIEDQDGIY